MSEKILNSKKVYIQVLSEKIDELTGSVGALNSVIGGLTNRVGKMGNSVNGLMVNVEDLAIATAKGFYDMHERFEKTDDNFALVEQYLGGIESGQGDIKLSLDNVAYRFEFIELQKRVVRLEGKTESTREA